MSSATYYVYQKQHPAGGLWSIISIKKDWRNSEEEHRTTLVTTINEDIKLFEATNQEAAAILEIAPLETLENLFHLARIAAERNYWKNITNAIHIAAQATQS